MDDQQMSVRLTPEGRLLAYAMALVDVSTNLPSFVSHGEFLAALCEVAFDDDELTTQLRRALAARTITKEAKALAALGRMDQRATLRANRRN